MQNAEHSAPRHSSALRVSLRVVHDSAFIILHSAFLPEVPMPATVSKILTKAFGSRNERLLKRYRAIVAEVNELAPEVEKKTDSELRARTLELREGLVSGKLRSVDALPEAFAIIRESMD